MRFRTPKVLSPFVRGSLAHCWISMKQCTVAHPSKRAGYIVPSKRDRAQHKTVKESVLRYRAVLKWLVILTKRFMSTFRDLSVNMQNGKLLDIAISLLLKFLRKPNTIIIATMILKCHFLKVKFNSPGFNNLILLHAAEFLTLPVSLCPIVHIVQYTGQWTTIGRP